MTVPVVVASAVREVQVYRSGALVTRVATLPADWPEVVVLDGLPLAVDDDSLRASVTGEGDALPRPADVRAELALPDPGEALAPSEVELRDATRRMEDAQARLARVEAELTLLEGFTLQLPAVDDEEPAAAPPRAPVSAWNGLLGWNGEARAQRVEERERLRDAVKVAIEERQRLLEREQHARARRDARVDGLRKRVVLQLRGGQRGGAPLTLRLEYRVPGARWVPSYVLRVARDGASAELALRAHIVQRTGETWERVRLSLSTADLTREMTLPELTSQRIGRSQPTPPKKAWREPPGGTEALFDGLDLALRALPRPTPPPASTPATTIPIAGKLELKKDKGRPGGAPPQPAPPVPMAQPSLAPPTGAPMPLGGVSRGMMNMPSASMAPPPMPASAPMRMPAPEAKKSARRPADMDDMTSGAMAPEMDGDFFGGVGGGGGPPGTSPALSGPLTIRPAGSALRYADLRMPSWEDRRTPRGKLRALNLEDVLQGLQGAEAAAIARRIVDAQASAAGAFALALPPGTTPVEQSAGSYDHRYDAEGLVDVPSDGVLHNVALLAERAPVKTTLVVVPRESDQAVRVAALTNPLDAPLLAGPAEVYLEDEFLVSTPLRTVPTGGDVVVGLGVEPALKVARNTFYEEKTHGLLGGTLTLEHRLELAVASRLGAPVVVEVRERVPVQAHEDEAVKVTETATPGWEKLRAQEDPNAPPPKGGRRWRITLAPGEEKKLVATYTVELDTKNELVGGNRRD